MITAMSFLEMSLYGGIFIVAIIVLRALAVHRLPKSAMLILWAAAFLRLTVPFTVTSPVSIYSAAGELVRAMAPEAGPDRLPADTGDIGQLPITGSPQPITGDTHVTQTNGAQDTADAQDTAPTGTGTSSDEPAAALGGAGTSSGQPAAALAGSGTSSDEPAAALPAGAFSLTPRTVLTLLWLCICVLTALGFLISHLRGRRIYGTSLPLEHPFIRYFMDQHRLRRPIQVRICDQIDSPLTYGILWPVILLPKNMNLENTEQLSFILAHELAHIRRFDALSKWLLAGLVCIHWFNPMVWAMYILANRDLELSCDDYVLRLHGRESRATYALTLVSLEEHRAHCSPLSNSFCKNAMKERITAIMKSKKTTTIRMALALVLVAGAISIFMPIARPEDGQAMAAGATAVSGSGNDKSTGNGVAEEAVGTANDRSTNTTSGSAAAAKTKEVRDAIARGVKEATQQITVNNYDDYDDYDDEGIPTYTQEQYDKVINTLKFKNYENMSIAEFNRKIYGAFNNSDDKASGYDFSEVYERVMCALPDDDPNAAFLKTTVTTSLGEYTARLNEVYTGKTVDPDYSVDLEITDNADVFGDQITVRYGWAYYTFTYRILDQDKLTVAARDKFLSDIEKGMRDYMVSEKLSADDKDGKDKLQKALEDIGKNASGSYINFTGGTIEDFDLDGKEIL